MRWQIVAKNWEAFRDSMLETWPELTEDDLSDVEGDRAAFEARLTEIGAGDRDEVGQQVAEWLEGAVPADVHMDEAHDNASIAESVLYMSPGEDASDDDRKYGDDNLAEDPKGS
ncbi:hypothetical protein [Falsirhodobacter xinxiangensis]|uniref:hypothetical protein n=1 Tax=Falsirhodobacter xinxiangensis TaxID=2530049 RepID=UPI0010AB028B|nr:hypothetical protein [Rhodobacter xinxiangensis]